MGSDTPGMTFSLGQVQGNRGCYMFQRVPGTANCTGGAVQFQLMEDQRLPLPLQVQAWNEPFRIAGASVGSYRKTQVKDQL